MMDIYNLLCGDLWSLFPIFTQSSHRGRGMTNTQTLDLAAAHTLGSNANNARVVFVKHFDILTQFVGYLKVQSYKIHRCHLHRLLSNVTHPCKSDIKCSIVTSKIVLKKCFK
eukprot:Gregarina_sp_Poly_1__521@NODE_1126_length_5010_cov_45_168521_g690_i2_p6_GENE_NODE_1126_length_5010_cov_45_168521_g690_i2NODE_1126_length_5010_cov_45_168521_g690_i2_p6_ORF_typecomplete_len112_score5_68_NODE_1126_length_5010_cov_45_168521_g690_i2659994